MSQAPRTPRVYLRGPRLEPEIATRSHHGGCATPFITIVRQIGVGGTSLPQRLAQALNAHADPDQPRWTAWDRELIEKVAADHHISVEAIQRLEQRGYSWLDTFLSGLGEMPDELTLLRQMQESVRGLARLGRVILVGHGSAFMTRQICGGLHIRLVAPLSQRVENLSRDMHLSIHEARRLLRHSQRDWTRFVRRCWPTQSLAPEAFAATLNTALLDEDHLVRCMVAMAT